MPIEPQHSTLPAREQLPEFTLPRRWRLLHSPPDRAAANMALDVAVQERAARDGVGILRTYSWSAPAVSFGRNEAIRGRFDAAEIAAAGLEAVRRPTGGRALLHDAELTYSVGLPLGADVTWRHAYDAVNRVLLAALRALGVDARLVPHPSAAAVARAMPPASAAAAIPGLCFDAPSPGEIVVGDAKLVGSAVWRAAGSFLQQGSIVVAGDQALLRRLEHATEREPEATGHAAPSLRVASLRSLGIVATVDDLVQALARALARVEGIDEVLAWHGDDALQRAATSRVNHFDDPSWLWRR